MSTPTDEFVICGVTLDGRPFRPSDWAERLCGVMSQFGADHRMAYSPYVQPITSEGVRCVVVDARLRELEPLAWNFLAGFARDNELRVRPGRLVLRDGDVDPEAARAARKGVVEASGPEGAGPAAGQTLAGHADGRRDE